MNAEIPGFRRTLLLVALVLSSLGWSEPAGRRIHVPAGGDFQAALDEARFGDTIVLAAGATYTGPFRLRAREGTGWITVTTSAEDRLPSAGRRIAPAQATPLPKLQARSDAVIRTESGAHHYRFVGIEVAPADNTFLRGLVEIGDNESDVSRMPHHFVIDRCYIHGDRRLGARRGIALNGGDTTVTGSYLSDFKEVGADSQAIAGWNGPGPFRITNNYLEGAGENVMFGGADPAAKGLVPSDIEITRNHLAKPLRWKKGHPAFEGTAWTIKNLFELKNARRVRVEGNLLEYNWVDAQNGFAILFTVRNQDGAAPWSTVEDVVFSGNLVRHAGAGVNILGRDDNHPSGPAHRITIRNNLFEDVGGSWGSGRLFQLLDGAHDVTIDRNTASHTGSILSAGDHGAHQRFVFTGNVVSQNEYGIVGSGTGAGLPSIERYFPGATIRRNAIIAGDPARYPAGNLFPKNAAAAKGIADAGADVPAIRAMAHRVASAPTVATAIDLADSSRDGGAAAAVFWGALLLLAYTYVGYPLLAWLTARIAGRPRPTASIEPTVSILIVAHDEAARIEGRIENLLALDYPRERLEILVGSDGSADATVSRATRYETAGVQVHAFHERRGKPAVLNDLVQLAHGEILVFADARQRFERGAVRALVAAFADPHVGAVSGELILRPASERTPVARGQGFYWRYEKCIRASESRSGATLSVTGAIYAIRRTLYEPVPCDTILDDVVIPARIVRRGYAVLFEPRARAYDEAPASARHEYVRKVRTIAGNFQLFARERWLLSPRENPLWFATVSHKLLRLALPAGHAALLLSNIALAGGWIYQATMAAQLAFYAAAAAAPVFHRRERKPLVVAVPSAICLMLAATIAGFLRFVTQRQQVTWERVDAITLPRS